jgi:hypothetical protein
MSRFVGRGAVRGRFRSVLLLACAIVVVACVGVAYAAANAVHVAVPAHAKVNVLYSITINGKASGPKRLYLFVDNLKCAGTPAAEHQRANGDIWNLNGGSFSRTAKGWRSPRAGTVHACTYLQKPSVAVNGATGIVARGFKSYTVHP